MVIVVTLLAHGSPVQAIVAAFGVDERTVADWQQRAGQQGERVHRHLVQAGRVALGQGQTDELRVRVVGGVVWSVEVVWLAMAISVRSRLWLGGVMSVRRDRMLLGTLLAQVATCGPVAAVRLCTDGLSSYPRQALRRFRQAVRTGGRGRPPLILPKDVLIAQATNRYTKRRVRAVERRIVRGSAAAVAAVLSATPGKTTAVVNTASIERLNATFRARLAPLVRRSRATVRHLTTLDGGRGLMGVVYNFCTPHRSLGAPTPAQATGLTDHCWTMHELLTFPVPLPQVKRRGRPPDWFREVTRAA